MKNNWNAIFEPGFGAKQSSLFLSRFLHNKMLIIGGIIVALFLFAAILAPLLTHYDPKKMDFSQRFSKPSLKHILGTDHYGRDTYSRILFGARVSCQVGFLSVLIGLFCGVVIGSLAGIYGGFIDNLLMRIMDALLAFPPLLLAIGLVASMGPSLLSISIAIGVVYVPRFARVMRSSVLAEREKEYVEAASAIGQTKLKILIKHIGPSSISPVIVFATIIFALAIIIEAALSFLGIGIPPPTPSWGTLLNDSRRYLASSIWMPLFPGLAISFAVLGFNLLGDGLRDFFDPKSYIVSKLTID